MKRILAAVICLLMLAALPVIGCADVDLSGMTYDELVALKDKINLAIWNSDEWQEVEVPQGVWEVGADIPAGKWTIKPRESADTKVVVGDELKDGGTDVNVNAWERITSASNKYFEPNSDVTEWTIELENGDYVKIESGYAIFSPYSGKPTLGFK